jgi:hypothetical protein
VSERETKQDKTNDWGKKKKQSGRRVTSARDDDSAQQVEQLVTPAGDARRTGCCLFVLD